MTLTWAATIRQPSGKRTQVCICRPTLPGALSRRNRVAAIGAVAAVSDDAGPLEPRARPAGERAARNAWIAVVAVEVLAGAVADGGLARQEETVERGDVVGDSARS